MVSEGRSGVVFGGETGVRRGSHGYGAAVPGDFPELRFEMDRLVTYDDASILAEIQRVAALLGTPQIGYREFDKHGRVGSSTIRRRFGSWKEALKAAGLGDLYTGRTVSGKMRAQGGRSMTAQEVVAEMQRIARLLGKSSLSQAELQEHSEIVGARVVRSRFGSWKAALEAAGLEITGPQRRWTDDDYFDNLLEVWTHYGRAPKYDEMNKPPSRITNGGYAAKFGTWGRAKQAFVDRVNRDIEEGERQRLETAAPTRREPLPPTQRQEDRKTIPVGLRYQVLRRDNFKCVLCGRSPATNPSIVLHVDHVLAFSRGGKTRLDNLRSLCQDCNLGKSDGA